MSPPAFVPHAVDPAGPRIALFDLDGTLIPGDSDQAFGEFMVTLGWADATTHRARNNAFYQQYLDGVLDIDEYVAFSTSAWRERTAEELAWAQQRFMAEIIAPQLTPQARALVRRHQDAGDRVLIVTATNVVVTRPIADAFGVPELIGIEVQRDAQGRYTGLIDGTPSFREGKIARVEAWLAARGLRWDQLGHSVFYSDSTNDLPLLERVQEPVATNPGPGLEAIARERGWRILRLFDR
ncbi:MAG: hypothetical protein RLY78_1718 [Pseudomonadota bacterium]|jgi:HAD superfamily hydrolase (TIGR01490 family)|uniref:HAD family hydrolase n=1 Tax=Pseudaquabacterium rugosum TaxID=2984194 RepID=A0ABU9B7A2_9BURK